MPQPEPLPVRLLRKIVPQLVRRQGGTTAPQDGPSVACAARVAGGRETGWEEAHSGARKKRRLVSTSVSTVCPNTRLIVCAGVFVIMVSVAPPPGL